MKIYQFQNLQKYNGVVNGISTRDFDSMKKDDGKIDRENLGELLEVLKLSGAIVCMGQVHSADVAIVGNSYQMLIENTDGLITDKKNISLCVMTADCLPIMFLDVKKDIIGVAHAGRIGLEKGIIKNILQKFKEDFGSDTSDIKVGVGPGIEKKCYEINGEFVDIRKTANELLKKEGILEDNIENLDICTKCNKNDFYSYRGGDEALRFASVISLI